MTKPISNKTLVPMPRIKGSGVAMTTEFTDVTVDPPDDDDFDDDDGFDEDGDRCELCSEPISRYRSNPLCRECEDWFELHCYEDDYPDADEPEYLDVGTEREHEDLDDGQIPF